GNIGIRRTIAWVVVLGGHHQALSGQRRDRRLRQFVDIGGRPLGIVDGANVMPAPPPLRKTRSFATTYCSGLPPSFFAAISWSFFLASIAVAYAARVIACVVWLPPDTQ